MNEYLAYTIAAGATYCCLPLLSRLAYKFNILDFPGTRKIHRSPTPLVGGLAIYIGFIVGLLCIWENIAAFLPVVVAATIIMILGLLDDMRGLSAQMRLIFQLLAALIVIGGGFRIDFLPNNSWGDIGEIVITIIWLIGVTNAYNYLDGIDGLAAGSGVINLCCFAMILFNTHQKALGAVSIILVSACSGFLPYNFRKQKIFLGDSGSTLLGFLTASFAVTGYWAIDNVVKISIPILILGVPIFDMVFTTIMRIKDGKIHTVVEWLQYGGRDHFHHYLIELGLGYIGAVLLIYSLTVYLGISAIMITNASAAEAMLTLVLASVIFIVIAILIVAGKNHHTHIPERYATSKEALWQKNMESTRSVMDN